MPDMSETETAAQMIEALTRAAREAVGAETPLVSVTMEFLREGAPASVSAEISRRTRTLVFAVVEAKAADGTRIATASSVHKIRS